VRMRLAGYEEWSGQVEVKENEFSEVTGTLERSVGTLLVESEPAGASARIEGGDGPAQTVETPGRVKVPTGKYEVRYEKTGYAPASRTAQVTRNTAVSTSVRLEERKGPQPGQAWTVPELELAMQWISPGSFTMGSPAGEADRSTDERQHEVTLSAGYWLGKYEVTQREYTEVMGSSPSHFKGDALPVENVSWEEAKEFCRKLTERERSAGRLAEGYEYRLPTEAQWEYACRAGTRGAFAGELSEMAWYGGNAGGKTQPVGKKRANDWGLHDMHGNVWEWCEDWYGEYAGGTRVTNPTGAASGTLRVFRGGGWFFTSAGCRSAFRDGFSPDYRYFYLGFRAALSSVR
jgi:formylglycine-generating enzyme required for sulfatase activity